MEPLRDWQESKNSGRQLETEKGNHSVVGMITGQLSPLGDLSRTFDHIHISLQLTPSPSFFRCVRLLSFFSFFSLDRSARAICSLIINPYLLGTTGSSSATLPVQLNL